ncbi:MAG: carboxylesterase family protein [Bacteroidetes bacterium]|nr:carboxylesterase family protein [Bacteroidota bacterium]
MKLFKASSLTGLLVIFIFYFFSSCSKNDSFSNGNGGNNGGPVTNPNVTVISDIQYGTNKDMQGNMVNLKLDVYMPSNLSASDKLPFIFFVHGGGFVGGDKSSAASALTSFAEAGFVGASIDYRLDSSLDAEQISDPCLVDSSISQKSVYMSIQDAKAAMRFLFANAAKYHIDLSRVFLNGNSAGAVTILNSYYLDQEYFNKAIPGIVAQLGNIDNADNNIPQTSFNVIGIAANSGCLPDPTYMTSANVAPTIYFNGGEDSVIPAKQGHAYYCPNSMYVYGSETLYARSISLGSPAIIHIDPDGGHGPYTEDFLTSNELCFFNSVLGKKVQSGSYSGQASSCP